MLDLALTDRLDQANRIGRMFLLLLCLFAIVLCRQPFALEKEQELARLDCEKMAANKSVLLAAWQKQQSDALGILVKDVMAGEHRLLPAELSTGFAPPTTWRFLFVTDSSDIVTTAMAFPAQKGVGADVLSEAAVNRTLAALAQNKGGNVFISLPLSDGGQVSVAVEENELLGLLKDKSAGMSLTLIGPEGNKLLSTENKAAGEQQTSWIELGGGFSEYRSASGQNISVYRKNTGGIFGWSVVAEKELPAAWFPDWLTNYVFFLILLDVILLAFIAWWRKKLAFGQVGGLFGISVRERMIGILKIDRMKK